MKESTRARLAIVIATLLAAVSVYLTLVRNPRPVSARAAGMEFSAENAMRHLEAIALKPRPWQGNEEARSAIVDALLKDGLHPEIQTYSSVISRNKPVQNVAVRIPGTQSSGAIVVTAHYDTMAQSPGAGDDGSGTAVAMELARAIRTGPAMKNDLIVVLTDAEEFGLIGAIAFAGSHPWMRDVRLAINLEGVVKGPLAMWRMGADEGWLVEQLVNSGSKMTVAPYLFSGPPMGDTDFTAFSLKGLPGYDLFTPYSYPNNHSMEDLPSGIDPASVQKAGDVLVRLVRHVGGISFPSPMPDLPERAYFNLFNTIISYPTVWIPFISLAVFLFVLAAAGNALRLRLIDLKGLLAGFLSTAGMLALIPLIVTIVWRMMEIGAADLALGSIKSTLVALFRPHDWPHSPNDAWQLLAYLSLAAALAAGGVTLVRRWVTAADSLAGALLAWCLLMSVTALILPSANYLLAGPVAINGIAFVLLVRSRNRRAWWSIPVSSAAVYFSLVLLLPALYLLYMATGLGTVPITSFAAVLAVVLIAPHFSLSRASAA
jgi:hypothetical protein